MIVVAKPKLGPGLSFIEMTPDELAHKTPGEFKVECFLVTVEAVRGVLTPFAPYPTLVADTLDRFASMPIDGFVDWLMASPSASEIRETVLMLDFMESMPNPFKAIALLHHVPGRLPHE